MVLLLFHNGYERGGIIAALAFLIAAKDTFHDD